MDSVHGREGECLLYVWYDRGSSPPPQCCPSACKLTGAGGGGAYMGECLETSGDGIPYGGGHPGHWSTGGYIFSSGQTFGFTDGEGDKRLCFTSFPSDVRCLNAKRKKKTTFFHLSLFN